MIVLTMTIAESREFVRASEDLFRGRFRATEDTLRNRFSTRSPAGFDFGHDVKHLQQDSKDYPEDRIRRKKRKERKKAEVFLRFLSFLRLKLTTRKYRTQRQEMWLGFAVVLLSVTPLFAEDWPKWGGPRGDHTWNGPALPQTWPEKGLPTEWTRRIGAGYGGVSVVGDRVFVMDRVTEPEEQERILCCSTETGEPFWTHPYPVAYGKLDYGNGPRVTPTIHEGRVYTLGAMGHLRCVNAADGDLVWQHDLVTEAEARIPEWGLAASPVIWNDLVIVHPGAKNGCLMAFDRHTGKEVWRAGDDPAGYSTPIIAESPSGPQLIAWSPENVFGVAPATGKILWKVPYKVTYGVSIATPLYREGLVFVSGYWEGSKAIRLGRKPEEATLAWTDDQNLRGLMMTPLYRDGLVYSIDKQLGLTCFELQTGRKLWDDNNKFAKRDRNPHAMAVWIGNSNRILGLNAEGNLILARLSRDGYQEESRTHLIDPTDKTPIWAHPAFAGNRIYARSDAELKCVELVPKAR